MLKNPMSSNGAYPRVITPDIHQLKTHYKRLNSLVLLAIPALVLVNEFIFRNHLAAYRGATESLASLFILALNGEIQPTHRIPLRNLLMGTLIVYTSIACLLPKWTLGPRGAIVRSSPPRDFEELALARFHVKNQAQHAVFWIWHHVLVVLPMAIVPVLCCFLLSIARS